ncbi:MAG: glycosyltransferase [Vampirovibrionales bacterium]|nr:glycosyltransferase [Vampirovibrionales bacterium]
MKILYCYPYGILGGVATVLSQRFEALAQLNIMCDYACLKPQGLTQAHFPASTRYIDSFSVRQLAQMAPEYDALVLIDWPEGLSCALETQKPVFYECHGSKPDMFKGLQHYAVQLSQVRAVIVPSDVSAALWRAALPAFNSERVYVVPNGLNLNVFCSNDVFEAKAKAVMPSAETGPWLLWVGKLNASKNWEAFLVLVQQLRARGIMAQGLIIGGASANTEAQAALTQAIYERGLCQAVKWLSSVPYALLPRFYRLAAASGGLHVITSQHESFAMTAVESLASACPVVATPVGILPTLAEQYPQFVQVASVLDDALLAAVLRQIETPKASAEQVLQMQASLRAAFSITTLAQAYAELIRRHCK